MRGDICLGPAQDRRHVLGAGGPGHLRGKPVVDVDADHAVARGPKRNVVGERRAGRMLVAAHEAAAVHMNQHRPRRRARLCGLEDIERVQVAGPVLDVADDRCAGIRLAVVQRRVEGVGLGRIDDAAEAAIFSTRSGGICACAGRHETSAMNAAPKMRMSVLPVMRSWPACVETVATARRGSEKSRRRAGFRLGQRNEQTRTRRARRRWQQVPQAGSAPP